MFGREGALRAARHHLERAESPALRDYWQRVIDGIERKPNG
jgi:hypothetical protein